MQKTSLGQYGLFSLGLNVLLRHKCSIDLQRMVLRFGDGTETPFLSEAEFQREKEAVHNDGILI